VSILQQPKSHPINPLHHRISTPSHQAQKVFQEDVSSTYDRIRTRAAELAKERSSPSAGVEQIQLHAVDPNTKITISIPSPTDTEAREIFNSFSPELQKSLESGSLDEVNKVLGAMSVEEAEAVVAKLGEGGMLSLEEGVIDATTEEGREALKRFEEGERARAKQVEAEEAIGDPE
jgi:cell division cycle protein 37